MEIGYLVIKIEVIHIMEGDLCMILQLSGYTNRIPFNAIKCVDRLLRKQLLLVEKLKEFLIRLWHVFLFVVFILQLVIWEQCVRSKQPKPPIFIFFHLIISEIASCENDLDIIVQLETFFGGILTLK